MSPLSEAIYQILADRAGQHEPLITYTQLVKELPPLSPPYDQITRDDKRLFRALGEVGNFCLDHGLPSLTALVIRSIEKTPGKGYFQMFHPGVGDDPDRQQQVWEHELEKVKSADYSKNAHQSQPAKPTDSLEDRRRSNQVGVLRIADSKSKPTTIFTGQITCLSCSKAIEIEVERNPMAFSDKQPSFVILESGSSSHGSSIGHMFVGTILSSPILYYGSLNHCNTDQRVVVFFNRGLRDRSDHHLSIVKSAHSDRDALPEKEASFKLD